MNKKIVLCSILSTSLYTAIACAVGIFGDAPQKAVLMIVPYFVFAIGLVLSVVLPYRIIWALERNKEVKRKIEEEKRIAAAAEKNRRMKAEAMKYERLNDYT